MKDAYGREIQYLRLSVTDLCDLRCRYCMPAEGVCKLRHEDVLTEDEMLAAVEAAASLGVRKLRVTGGEPLLKKNLLSLCRRAAAVPGIDEVCLTTNGRLLPALAKPLREAGVRRLNLSLDTLRPETYRKLTRREPPEDLLAGLHAALDAGFDKIKLNVVLLGGWNEDEIPALAALTKTYPIDVRFIERMPLADDPLLADAYLPAGAALRALPELLPECAEGVARLYRLPGAQGRIGLISPISAPFCASCDRLRLTADGHLRPCLHSALEYPLKGLSRAEMVEAMKTAIWNKPRCHALSPSGGSGAGRTMNTIGG